MNYFDNKYDELCKINDNTDVILNKMVEIVLYQSNTGTLKSPQQKFNAFWSSEFINNIEKVHLISDNYQLALSQYIRSVDDINEVLLQSLITIDVTSVIYAIRLSNIISNPNHTSWLTINNVAKKLNLQLFNDFLETVKLIDKNFQQLKEEYQSLKRQTQLDQITAMLFNSLYTCEYIDLNEDGIGSVNIPYQIDLYTIINENLIWRAMHQIIMTVFVDKKILTEKRVALSLLTVKAFLFDDGMTEKLLTQYENYKQLVALKVEINLYQDKVIDLYSYNKTTNYFVKNNKLQLDKKAPKKEIFQDKFAIISTYWQYRGILAIADNKYFALMDRGENVLGNMTAVAKTQSVLLQLKEVYGIESAMLDKEYDLSDLVFTMLLSQAFYKIDFIDPFNNLKNNSNLDTFQILAKLMFDGAMTGENRMPVTFSTLKDKSIKMSSWIIDGSNKAKKKMREILEFWSVDLKDKSQKNLDVNDKLFYTIDEYIFQLPFRIGRQNINTATINTFRKLYKNRNELKSETDLMEKNLADLFSQFDCKVYCQHDPEDKHVGEIDLMVVTDSIALIIELKSTYIKGNVKEVYEYKKFTLNKASYQLDRKRDYFINQFLSSQGYQPKNMQICSWIVDTTLEYDHEMIGNHLKISLEELIIYLNQHHSFIDDMLSEKKLILDENRLSIDQIIQKILDNEFWERELERVESLKA